MMIQSDVTLERTAAVSPCDEDDDPLFDSWLASLSTREFECILDGLAHLEISARQRASA